MGFPYSNVIANAKNQQNDKVFNKKELMKILINFYDNAEFQDLSISDARNTVINYGVTIVKYMSMYLAFLLDINNYQTSTSFGNTSNALSLQQKLNLFSDLGYVEKEEKKKLKLFFEIRNQFAHTTIATPLNMQ